MRVSEAKVEVEHRIEKTLLTANRVTGADATILRKSSSAVDETAERVASHERDIRSYGRKTAEWLGASAGFVSELDPVQIRNNAADGLRRNIGRSLVVAGMLGLVIGLLVGRRAIEHSGKRA
jgi:hypothetical protein